MAAVHGKGGDVSFTSIDDGLVTITGWGFTASSDTADASGMGDSFRTNIPGLDTFTATAEAVAQTTLDHAVDIGTGATLTLQTESGKTTAAAAILTSITETASIDDVGRLSMAFEGNADTVTYPS